MKKKNTLSTDANEFVIIDNKKNEPQYQAVSDFVVGPAILIKKQALNTWAN